MSYFCPAWAVNLRRGQGHIHSSGGVCCCVWVSCDTVLACLPRWILQKMHPHLQWLSYLIWSWSHVLRWLRFSCYSLEILCPENCCRAVKAVQFPYLGSCFCKDVSGYATQYSSIHILSCLSSETETTEWQREANSTMFFSVKPLLKFPGQLISFPPCSAIATSIFPKTSSLLYLPAAKLLSAVCL